MIVGPGIVRPPDVWPCALARVTVLVVTLVLGIAVLYLSLSHSVMSNTPNIVNTNLANTLIPFSGSKTSKASVR